MLESSVKIVSLITFCLIAVCQLNNNSGIVSQKNNNTSLLSCTLSPCLYLGTPLRKLVGLIIFASMPLVPFSAMPPYIPSISSLDDTSNFDEVEKAKPPPNLDSFQPNPRDFSGRHLPFVGFTFSRCADAAKAWVLMVHLVLGCLGWMWALCVTMVLVYFW